MIRVARAVCLAALLLLLAAPALAQTTPAPTGTPTVAPPTETPTLTVTPTATATLTIPEAIVVKGFDAEVRERIGREWGFGIVTFIVLALLLGGWWLRPYWKRLEERREKEAAQDVDHTFDSAPPDPFTEATRAYLERFEAYYSRFSFRGLEDVSGAKVPLFNKAYISLRLAAPVARRASGKENDPDEMTRTLREGAAREVTLAEAIRQTPRLALVGAAGSGKSTLLQWAGVSVARIGLPAGEPLKDEQKAFLEALGQTRLLPVFIALRDFVRYCHPPGQPIRAITPAALVEFIGHFYAEQFSSMAFPPDFFHRHLKQGCLLMLDGVDEVSPKDRVAVRNAVEGLVIDYGVARNRYLLTSRSVAYKGEVEFSEFQQIEVQPLNREQRNALLGYWCDAIYLADEAARNAADLGDGIDRSDERVRDLARTPLMVSIFVLVYYHNQRRLPNQRAEFYYRAARVLVSETHKPGAPDYPEWERLSLETRIDHLKRVAYELYCRSQNSATAEELVEWCADEFAHDKDSARQFFTAAANRSGLLEEKGGQYGFFTHKTFHEFLAGLYLAQNLEDDPHNNWTAILTARLLDDQWLEVTRLAAGALAYLNAAKANKFVKLLSDLGQAEAEQTAALERAALAQADFPLDRAQTNRADLVTRLERQMVNTQLKPEFRRPLGLALAALGDPRLRPGQAPEMVTIPAGEFRMGTSDTEAKQLKEQNAESWDDEKPQHTVFVSEFQIGRYPVTNAEFRAFVEAQGYHRRKWWSEAGWRWRMGELEADLSIYSEENRKTFENWLKGRPKKRRHQPFFWDDPQWNQANLPVVGVTWYEAEAYCKWLSAVTAEHYRLPTEAEWEKAARGPQNSLWPWGNAWDAERCNSEESKFNGTTPVGMYPHGAAVWPGGPVEDLVGNVWEWCADAWQANAYAGPERKDQIVRDPYVSEPRTARLVRGGSYLDSRRRGACRSAARYRLEPMYFNDNLGFRAARSPLQLKS